MLCSETLALEVSLVLDDFALLLLGGCAMTRTKQNTATNSNGAPMISPRVSSLCSMCIMLWLKCPPIVFVKGKDITFWMGRLLIILQNQQAKAYYTVFNNLMLTSVHGSEGAV